MEACADNRQPLALKDPWRWLARADAHQLKSAYAALSRVIISRRVMPPAELLRDPKCYENALGWQVVEALKAAIEGAMTAAVVGWDYEEGGYY